jgi:glycosyltransferase involved in cell wall biosynthesis
VRVVFLAAGAGGMYCGSCLRDAALARAMRELGHDFILVPLYTPLRLDEETPREERVFFGGVDVYLQEKFPSFRENPGRIGALLASQKLLRWISKRALRTNPRDLGALTVSMLRGEEGNQRRSLDELASWIERGPRPDVVHLSNVLFVGLARELRRRLGVPVVAGLQGEDLFLEGLVEPYRTQAIEAVRRRARDVDRFIATSAYYAAKAAEWLGIDRGRIDVAHPGISLEGWDGPPAAMRRGRGRVIGYFARISPEKGLHFLAGAFGRLATSVEFGDVELRAAGYLGPGERPYAAWIRRSLAARGLSRRFRLLGTADRETKLAFFRGIDVFSVPTIHPEPKGNFLVESFAAGVPAVVPAHGSMPELVEASGGGLLFEPENEDDLAEKLGVLLRDPELRARLGESAREAARARFTSRSMAESTAAAYWKVLSVAGRPVEK